MDEIRNCNLRATIPLHHPPVLPPSNKSMLLASSGGPQPVAIDRDGKPVVGSFNAYYKAK